MGCMPVLQQRQSCVGWEGSVLWLEVCASTPVPVAVAAHRGSSALCSLPGYLPPAHYSRFGMCSSHSVKGVRGFEPRWMESQTCLWARSCGPIPLISASAHIAAVTGHVESILWKHLAVRRRNLPFCSGQRRLTLLEGTRRWQQVPRPDCRFKGVDKCVRRKARMWFKSCQFKAPPSNVRIEWIIPQEHGPGSTAVVLILWKQHTPVLNTLRLHKKWEDQTKDGRPWAQCCSMLHTGRSLWLFPF